MMFKYNFCKWVNKNKCYQIYIYYKFLMYADGVCVDNPQINSMYW